MSTICIGSYGNYIAFEKHFRGKLRKLGWETTLRWETTGRLVGLGGYWGWEATLDWEALLGDYYLIFNATEIGADFDLTLLPPYRKNLIWHSCVWGIALIANCICLLNRNLRLVSILHLFSNLFMHMACFA